jgi:MiaB/RimO family radical SAM methylthiotransferase
MKLQDVIRAGRGIITTGTNPSSGWLRRGLSTSSSSSSVKIDRYAPSETTTTTKSRLLPEDGLLLADFVKSSFQKQTKTTTTLQLDSNSTTSGQAIATATPSFSIKTYGCQMNVSDSDIVRAVLLESGFREAASEQQADIWLTNTCAIRDNAERKVWQRLHGLKKQKLEKQKHQEQRQIVGLLGCMAERLQGELFQNGLADLVVGPDAYRDLPRLLNELSFRTNKNDDDDDDHDHDDQQDPLEKAMNVQLSLEETYADIVPIRSPETTTSPSAFVSIQRGCSNRCSFCIVPFTRGQERSRPFESILAEVTQLHYEQDVKEVILLGQNVNSYHDRSEAALLMRPHALTNVLSNDGFRNRIRRPEMGGHRFADLVEAISDVSPELRVRFTSPHPKDYPTELLHLMAERPNVCNQLHMPAQSGSSLMLQRMKRGYTREAYLELIDSVKTIIPDVALSSDFIAGFCEETDEEHADTVSLLQMVEYDQAFLFAYSLREKTHAHRTMLDNVPPDIKQARLQELIDVFRTTVHEKNHRDEVGKLRLVLVEGASKRKNNEGITTWHGRTDQNKRILFPIAENGGGSSVEDGEDNGAAAAVPTRDGDWIASQLRSWALLGDDSSLLVASTHRDADHATRTTFLVPGEYAVVEVTEAKGHTLRGQLLWKTTLAKFAELESNVLSKLDINQWTRFKNAVRQGQDA